VSIQAQIINLLRDLQLGMGLGMVFISHDLNVVRNLVDRVAVMYMGRIVEEGPTEAVFFEPEHPYTKALISSIPAPGRLLDPDLIITGDPPDPANRPKGCAFHPRCSAATEQCRHDAPQLRPTAQRRAAACHLVGTSTPSATT